MRSMNIFIFVLIFGIYNSSVEYSNGRLKKLHMIYYYQWWHVKSGEGGEKKRSFKFSYFTFPFMCNNIPAPPAYGVCISLSRYDIVVLIIS